jgi:MscS family membrane protein
MSEFLAKAFYGNTVGQWLLAVAIIVGALVVGKALFWAFSGIFKRLAGKTETKLDDILVDMIEEPIVFAVTVAGIWYGLGTLTLPERVGGWINGGVQFLIIISVTWMIARLLEALFSHYISPLADKSDTDLDDLLLPLVRKGTKVGVWSVGLIVAFNNAGYDVGALIAGLGIGGLALAMAAKDTVSNIFGGFTIVTDHPFALNDRVKVAGFDGNIVEIGIRSTRMRTLAGTLVTIPNAKFADSAVENVSEEPSRKVVSTLGLTYDTTPEGMEKAMKVIGEIAAENPALEEKTVIGFTEFADSSMNILFIYYITKGEDIVGAQTAVNLEILRRFTAEGLEMAFPTRTVYNIAQEA